MSLDSLVRGVKWAGLLAPVVSVFVGAYYYYGLRGLALLCTTLSGVIFWYGGRPLRAWAIQRNRGPKPTYFFGNMLDFKKLGMNGALRKFVPEYGSKFVVYPGQREMLVIADPNLIRDVCTSNFAAFHDRPPPLHVSRAIVRHLLFATGPYWKRLRQTVTPVFDSSHLKRFTQPMHVASARAIKRFLAVEKGDTVEMFRSMCNITLEVIGSTVFGVDLDGSQGDSHLARAAAAMFENSNVGRNPVAMLNMVAPFLKPIMPFLAHLLLPLRKVGGGGPLDELDTWCHAIIAARRAKPDADPRDFLGLMLNAAPDPETGLSLTDDEIKEQCRLFLLAGYETTANTLTYTTFLLSQNPQVEAKMLAEIDEVMRDKDGEALSYDDLPRLKYVGWVVQEALRVYPPAYMVARVATEDTEIDGYPMNVGDQVAIAIEALHHDPKYWPEPEAFRPERFDPESEEYQKRHKNAYMPFGVGQRMCIGFRFASEEAKLVLAELYSVMVFRLSAKQILPLRLTPNITQSPTDGIHMHVLPRSK